MVFYDVIIEHESLSLARSFTYCASAPILPGCRVRVPFGRQKLTGMVIGEVTFEKKPDFVIRPVLEIIDSEPVLSSEQIELAKYLAHQTISPMMSMVTCMLPSALSAKTKRLPPSLVGWLIKTEDAPEYPAALAALSASQKAAMDRLSSREELSKARKKISDYMIQTLVKKGLLKKEQHPSLASALAPKEQEEWPDLTQAQSRALDEISACDKEVIALYGVTGSGKTELYYRLARQALDEGRQVLILVPEIVLTPMMEERFASRFQEPIFSYHSRLTPQQALGVYNSIRHSGPCIVIGTRKSIFLPFSNLGLIVLDEEHDSSYKQETAPRYHARDAAIWRGRHFGCKVILGSATPSLDTYSRALKGVYGLVELNTRALNAKNRIRLIDLRTQPVYAGYSAELIRAVSARLSRQEKAMILLNRRGFLPTVRCLSCGEYISCEDCDLPLSYHKGEHALVCHVCGKRYPIVDSCPNCHSSKLATTGQGTERLEEETAQLFPSAHIVRMDHDTTSRKGEHAMRLEEFDTQGDILLGTQMIAKGLDFHEITLCAVLSIDTLLSRPDYLASEKAYQLAEQASGRAGRGKKSGEVLIQSYNPSHFVLQSILRHDFKGFFRQEMAFRKEGGYPPYSYLATVVIRHDDPAKAYNKAMELRSRFEACQIDVLGPAQISMRNRQSRDRLILRDRNDEKLIETLWQCARWFYMENNSDGTRMEINVHPMTIEE